MRNRIIYILSLVICRLLQVSCSPRLVKPASGPCYWDLEPLIHSRNKYDIQGTILDKSTIKDSIKIGIPLEIICKERNYIRYSQSNEDFHYILWYRIPEFEKKFSTKIHFKYKPDHLVIPGVSRTTASCILFEKDTMISIPKTHDKVISKYIDTNDNSIRKELRTIYYVTLAQRGKDKFWILMKYAPYNYHQKKSINRTSHFA